VSDSFGRRVKLAYGQSRRMTPNSSNSGSPPNTVANSTTPLREHAGESLCPKRWSPANHVNSGGGEVHVIHERCAGLDVHKKTVVVCTNTPDGKDVETFGTMTRELLRMVDWLLAKGVTHVAMESTGIFWRPVFNLLEGHGRPHLRITAASVPGRKSPTLDRSEYRRARSCSGFGRSC